MRINTVAVHDNSGSDHSATDILLSANFEIITQLQEALLHFSDAVYSHKMDDHTSSIGMHTRHIIEFYQELIKALDRVAMDHGQHDICYDRRQRHLQYETSRTCAVHELMAIKEALSRVPEHHRNLTLSVIVNPAQPLVSLSTSLERELYHVLDHMIHHMALIKLLAQIQDTPLEPDFGIAKATLDYHNSVQSNG